MLRLAFLFLLGPLIGGCSASFFTEYRHHEPRTATVDASGATRLEVSASTGALDIQGEPDREEVQVEASAAASSTDLLAKIELVAERRGDRVVVEARLPSTYGGGRTKLDLVLRVPARLEVEVDDGSGSLVIRDVAQVVLDDGSGKVEIAGVRGDVRIRDGSGSLEVRDVGGTVHVEDDGSGSMRIVGVSGDVIIDDDGSGSIHVHDVAGRLYIGDDGSGGIHHSKVQGSVQIPD